MGDPGVGKVSCGGDGSRGRRDKDRAMATAKAGTRSCEVRGSALWGLLRGGM